MAGGEFRFGTASIYMRRTSADRAARYNSQPRYYMASDLDRVRQFFPDFRRFIVMASRKLGLVSFLASGRRRRDQLVEGVDVSLTECHRMGGDAVQRLRSGGILGVGEAVVRTQDRVHQRGHVIGIMAQSDG